MTTKCGVTLFSFSSLSAFNAHEITICLAFIESLQLLSGTAVGTAPVFWLADNPIILYMKGTPEEPSCGFSAKAAAAIKTTGVAFAYVNVLDSPFIMERLPEASNWPTCPQLFVNGEIIGGCDIVEELPMSGELATMLKEAAAEATA
jgi:monothiol glutaredoxin